MPAWTEGLRRTVRFVVIIFIHAVQPASLLYVLVIDLYGLGIAFGVLGQTQIANSTAALLSLYLALILVLGAIWHVRTIRETRPMRWWEEMCDTRSSVWLSVVGLVLIISAGAILYQQLPNWRREFLLLGVVTGLPLLVGALQRRPRWYVVRPGQETQDLFQIAARLAAISDPRPMDPLAEQDWMMRVPQRLYEYNVNLGRLEGSFDPATSQQPYYLQPGLELFIPPEW